MARLPRLTVPGYPHHIIQRGNNRQEIFRTRADFELLLTLLGESAAKFGVAIHSYVLMDNHFHVLATPSTEDGVPKMVQAVGRAYVRHFNRVHGRTGTLWEGRYRSTLVQTERYLLACMAYIDLNPVRAGIVAAPEEYPWSSYGHYAGLRTDRLLTPHDLIWALGNTPFSREAAYRTLVSAGIGQKQCDALTQSALHGWVLGEPGFVEELAVRTPRRLAPVRAGRPVRRTASGDLSPINSIEK